MTVSAGNTDRTNLLAENGNLVAALVANPDLLKTVLNEIYDYLDANWNDYNTHKSSAVLGHPDGSVTTAKVADGAIVTLKLADGAVVTAKLADLGVTSGKIADGAILTIKIADQAIATAKVADGAITNIKIADGTIDITKLAATAKNSANHTYNGVVPSVTTTKTALDAIYNKLIQAMQTSSVSEVADARTSVPSNKTYTTLKDRLDDEIGSLLGVIVPADSYSSIQSAIDYVKAQGGGIVSLSAKVYELDVPLFIPSKVIVSGQGMDMTVIKPSATFTGTALVKSENFDSMTNQNKWLVGTDSMLFGLGLYNLCLDGNSLTIYGSQIYAKRIFMKSLRFQNCWSGGLYTEAGYSGGQSQPEDMPESIIDDLYFYKCKGWAYETRGAHDSYIKTVYISGNSLTGSKGFRVYKDPSATPMFNGLCEIGHLHIYGLESDGFYCNTHVKADSIISESVKARPVVIEGATTMISKLENYGDRNIGETAVLINASQCQINSIKVTDTNGKGNAVEINGNENIIGMYTEGNGSTGFGLKVNGRGNIVNGNIVTYSGAGGIGFDFNSGSASKENTITLNIRGCNTAVNTNSVNSSVNRIHLTGYGNTNAISGTFGSKDEISGSVGVAGGTVKYAKNNVQSDTFAIDSMGLKTVTIAHGLLYAPNKEKLQVSVNEVSAQTDWGSDLITIGSIDATNVTVKVNVTKASATAGSTAKIGLLAAV